MIQLKDKQLFEELSLKDKARLFVGKNFWETEKTKSLRSIFLSDGPHGIRKEVFNKKDKTTVKAICYPTSSLLGCSFDKSLLYLLGQELAKECIENNIDVLLGPGINIKRSPLCGRNFEYFSEDPILTGQLASMYVKGVQSNNVGTSLKHFAVNSQEHARFINDSIVDERALEEIYLKAFEIVVKEAHPWTIMASYNKINGIHATENKFLLKDYLKDGLMYDGVVVSDWGALHNPLLSLENGLNLEMPGISKGSDYLIYKEASTNEKYLELLNESTSRIIKLIERCNQFKVKEFSLENSLSLASKIASESMVLLKNEDDILPLKRNQSVALIGNFAKNPRYQGAGSSRINPIFLDNLFQVFKDNEINFEYEDGYKHNSLKPNKKLIKKACDVARNNDVVIIMCGLPDVCESEGYDRVTMKMPDSHLKLIEEVNKVNSNVVLVLQTGSPIEMPFIDNVKGVLLAYLGGSKHGEAIKKILYGEINPSGRLAETFPLKLNDVYCVNNFSSSPYFTLYKESIYVGYRYYDTFNKKVLFPFGYGLSYSDVTYSSLDVLEKDEGYLISVNVTNNSELYVKEVVQLYVGQLDSKIFKAKKELKAFEKVELNAKETKLITFSLSKEQLKYYYSKQKKWILSAGVYRFYVSKNVSDESLYVDLKVDSNDKVDETNQELSIYYSMDREVTNQEFENLIGRKLSLNHKVKPFTIDSPIIDFHKTFLGFIAFNIAEFFVVKSVKDKLERQMYKKVIRYQPIRSLQMMASMTKENIEGIVDIFNNHPIRGLKKIISKKGKLND